MILIDSVFVNNSGGKILLDYLLQQLTPYKEQIHLLLDERYPIDNLPDYRYSISLQLLIDVIDFI